VLRGSYVGSLHRGTVAAVSGDGDPLLSVGDPLQPAFLRSAA
jgi:L-asparaginase II